MINEVTMEEKRGDKNGNFVRFATQSISDKRDGIKNLDFKRVLCNVGSNYPYFISYRGFC